jgi:pimeloyl-ACP methyl ester carboxylesterase
MRKLMSLVTTGVLVYLGVCLLLYAGQRRLIYFPRAEVDAAPAEALWMQSEGERLKLWKLGGSGSRAIIYFGGNAEDVSRNIADYAQWLPGYATYLVNYRGYGGSSGSPSEAALFRDALNIYDALARQYERIAVVGRSLGSGVAMYLAAERPVDRLVLVTPFDSVEQVARRVMPVFPTRWMLKDRFDSLARVPSVEAPVLAMIAEYDGVIPSVHSDALIAAFPPEQLQVTLIPGADHNTVHMLPGYADSLKGFLGADAPAVRLPTGNE